MNRWKIYEGFVKHSITTQCSLLSDELQIALADGHKGLVDSFQAFAREIAFRACQNDRITFNRQEASSKLNNPWVNLKELVEQDALKQFTKREEELSNASEQEKVKKQHRAFFSKEDFISMMQKRRQQFETDLPFKIRGNEYEFTHKSLFEYFVAKRLIQLCTKKADFILEEDINSLILRLVRSIADSGIFLFLQEGLKEAKKNKVTKSLSIEEYGNDENSQRGLTNRAVLLNAIGLVLNDQSNYKEAIDYYTHSSAIREKVYGKENPATVYPYNNIGVVLKNQGKYAESFEYLLNALATLEKVLGKDHPETAISYSNIGQVLQAQGKYAEALEYHLKNLAINEKVLGKDHPYTATSYNNIGQVLQDQGKYAEALEYYLKALAISEKVLGKDHPETATSYNNIAFVLEAQEQYKESLEYFRKALAIREKFLGKEHSYTQSCMSSVKRLERKVVSI